MSTEMAVRVVPAAAPIMPAELKQVVRDTVFPDATDAELALFAHDCQRNGVHPLDRMIHPQVRTDKRGRRRYVAVTSIDLMRSRAAETGEHAGTDDAEYGACRGKDGSVVDAGTPGAVPESARVTVYRMVGGQRFGFTATARWLEYVPDAPSDAMWRKMPFLMLAKVAEALALRKAFPRQLNGMYEQAEMQQANPAMDAAAEARVAKAAPAVAAPALPAETAATIKAIKAHGREKVTAAATKLGLTGGLAAQAPKDLKALLGELDADAAAPVEQEAARSL